MKRKYLTAYDYGMGNLVQYILASSEAEIEKKFPQLLVLSDEFIPEHIDEYEDAFVFDIEGPYPEYMTGLELKTENSDEIKLSFYLHELRNILRKNNYDSHAQFILDLMKKSMKDWKATLNSDEIWGKGMIANLTLDEDSYPKFYKIMMRIGQYIYDSKLEEPNSKIEIFVEDYKRRLGE